MLQAQEAFNGVCGRVGNVTYCHAAEVKAHEEPLREMTETVTTEPCTVSKISLL